MPPVPSCTLLALIETRLTTPSPPSSPFLARLRFVSWIGGVFATLFRKPFAHVVKLVFDVVTPRWRQEWGKAVEVHTVYETLPPPVLHGPKLAPKGIVQPYNSTQPVQETHAYACLVLHRPYSAGLVHWLWLVTLW